MKFPFAEEGIFVEKRGDTEGKFQIIQKWKCVFQLARRG